MQEVYFAMHFDEIVEFLRYWRQFIKAPFVIEDVIIDLYLLVTLLILIVKN